MRRGKSYVEQTANLSFREEFAYISCIGDICLHQGAGVSRLVELIDAIHIRTKYPTPFGLMYVKYMSI